MKRGVCPKTSGQYFFISRVPQATFFDSVREAAMEAIRQIGEILEARLRRTQETLNKVQEELAYMKFMSAMNKQRINDFKDYVAHFQLD